MKKEFESIMRTEFSDIETNVIEECVNQERIVIKDNSILLRSKQKSLLAGYGRCRSCDCTGYISKHDDTHECKNCGHHFSRHRDY